MSRSGWKKSEENQGGTDKAEWKDIRCEFSSTKGGKELEWRSEASYGAEDLTTGISHHDARTQRAVSLGSITRRAVRASDRETRNAGLVWSPPQTTSTSWIYETDQPSPIVGRGKGVGNRGH